MQKIYLVLLFCVFLFTACKKEALLEKTQDVNPVNSLSKNPSSGVISDELSRKINSSTATIERQQCTTAISSNFNGTSIAGGRFIWFSSVMKVTGVGTTPVTINFYSQTITSSNFSVNVPDAVITIDPATSTATTTYNGTSWVSSFPASVSGNVFLSGVGYQVPSGGLPGGINPVVWQGSVGISEDNVSVSWQWAAAVYKSFSNNPAELGVKPCDANNISIYRNSDHAGTPENFKSYVTGGARGGGGSNFTGSYSSTKKFICTILPPENCPAPPTIYVKNTTFCGSGTFNGSLFPFEGDTHEGDKKTPHGRLSSNTSNTSNLDGSLVTTTWEIDGQVYTGNTVNIPLGENTTCAPIVKTIIVKVVCNDNQNIIKQSSIDITINPIVTSSVEIDFSFCTANILFSCPGVNNINWTIGTSSGIGASDIPVNSNPEILNYNYSAFGCNFSGSESVDCPPL